MLAVVRTARYVLDSVKKLDPATPKSAAGFAAPVLFTINKLNARYPRDPATVVTFLAIDLASSGVRTRI